MVTAVIPKDNLSLVRVICSGYVESHALVHGADEANSILLGFQIPALVDGMVRLRHVKPCSCPGMGTIRDLQCSSVLAVDTHERPVVGGHEPPLLVVSVVALVKDDLPHLIGVAAAVDHIVLVGGTGDKVPLLGSGISLIPPLSILLLLVPASPSLLAITLVVALVVVAIATLAPITLMTPHCKICLIKPTD